MNKELLKMEIKNAVKTALTDTDQNKIVAYRQQIDDAIRIADTMIKDAKTDAEKRRTMTRDEKQRYKFKLDQSKVDVFRGNVRNFFQKLVNENIFSRAAAQRLLSIFNSSSVLALNESYEDTLKNIVAALKGARELLDKKV